ncbi:MAG: hypothetical protein A2169_08315 [Deltaproteobacteria bacterium RBG_13_47_9]|nr:MAG: hypothetical protein A2169_08315 [Deltaproteobacteria bacterium RBG_13_47_9]
MEKDRVQRYAESLSRTIQNNYHCLKQTMEDFQEMCRIVTPEKKIPPGIMIDIREMYKEIRNRMTEIKAIEQLLRGKYREHYKRNPLRDKEIMEFGFIAKNCYSKFEFTLMQIQAIKKLKEEESPKADLPSPFFKWVRSQENQVTFIRNLRILNEIDYGPSPQDAKEKRDLTGTRSLTLFLFKGDSSSMDRLQSQIRLRENDIIERYGPDEVRGVLTHLRKIDPSELEKVFKHFIENRDLMKLKCILFPIHSSKDLGGDIFVWIKTALREMSEGEVKTYSILLPL